LFSWYSRVHARACVCARVYLRFCRQEHFRASVCVCVCECVCVCVCVCLAAARTLFVAHRATGRSIARPATVRAACVRAYCVCHRPVARVAAGAMWTNRTPSAPWAARAGHTTVIDAAGAIYVLGGSDGGSTYYNDVLVSTDGGADRTGLPWGTRAWGMGYSGVCISGTIVQLRMSYISRTILCACAGVCAHVCGCGCECL
jgi:hypothetical protein